MSGGMFRPASIVRTSLDASSSAWPGAMSACRLTGELPVVALQRARAEAALELRDVVDADRHPSADGTVSLPIGSVSRRWFSSTRILTGYCSAPSRKFEISSSPATASRSVLPMVAMRTPEIGGAPAVDRDVDLGIRNAQLRLRLRPRLGSFCACASACIEYSASLSGRAPRMFAEIGEAALPSPPPSALRDVMLGLIARMRREPPAHLRDHLLLRVRCARRSAGPGRGNGCGSTRPRPARRR